MTSPTPLSKKIKVEELGYAANIAKHFYGVHSAIRRKEISELWLKGGRGSTKSSFAALTYVKMIIEDANANVLGLRKYDNTIRLSLLPNFLWAIQKLGAYDLFSHTRAPAEISYTPTNQKILLRGLDDPQKMKSIKTEQGYLKGLWFEEGSEFDGMEEIRSVEQSVLRGGDEFLEIISYNPPNDPNAWVNVESLKKHPGRYVHTSDYTKIPPEWLGTKFLEKADALKVSDRTKFEHEYMGLAVGRAEQIVFHGKWEVKEFDAPAGTRHFFGADWGFATDPTVLVRFHMRTAGKYTDLFIDFEAFGYGTELDHLSDLFRTVPEATKWPIKADCSRPETISYLRRQGFNISGADKWPGCDEDGIEHIRGFRRIYVHPRCVNIAREFAIYSFKVDRKTQQVLPKLIDRDNHGMDSLRYGLDKYIQRKGASGVWTALGK